MTLKNKSEKILYILLLSTLLSCTSLGNEGHRFGVDLFEGIHTENSLESFRAPLSGNFSKYKQFKYYELGIRETSDSRLILYHDRYFSRRLLDDSDGNKRILIQPAFPIWKRYKVRNLSLDMIKELKLKNGEIIPTLKEFLKTAEQYEVKDKIFMELKEPLSRTGMEDLYDLLSLYKYKLSLSVLMYPRIFRAIKKEHSNIINILYKKQTYFFETKRPKTRKFIFDL